MADVRSMQPQNKFMGSLATGLRDFRDTFNRVPLGKRLGDSLIGQAPEIAEHYAYHSPFKDNVEGVSPRYPELHRDDAMALGNAVIDNSNKFMPPTLRRAASLYNNALTDEARSNITAAAIKGLLGAERMNMLRKPANYYSGQENDRNMPYR